MKDYDVSRHDLLPSWWPSCLSPSRIDTWQENNVWYMRLEYRVEYNNERYVLKIPKVHLGYLGIHEMYTLQWGFADTPYSYANLGLSDCINLDPDDHGNVAYIEKELGYKVKEGEKEA